MSSKGVFLIDKFFDESQYSDIINDINYSFDHMPLLDNKTWGETVTEFSKPIKIKALETKDTHYQLIKNNIYHLIGTPRRYILLLLGTRFLYSLARR